MRRPSWARWWRWSAGIERPSRRMGGRRGFGNLIEKTFKKYLTIVRRCGILSAQRRAKKASHRWSKCPRWSPMQSHRFARHASPTVSDSSRRETRRTSQRPDRFQRGPALSPRRPCGRASASDSISRLRTAQIDYQGKLCEEVERCWTSRGTGNDLCPQCAEDTGHFHVPASARTGTKGRSGAASSDFFAFGKKHLTFPLVERVEWGQERSAAL